MTEYRIHYMPSHFLARCGIILPRNQTRDPEKVTCKTCLKLLKGEVK